MEKGHACDGRRWVDEPRHDDGAAEEPRSATARVGAAYSFILFELAGATYALRSEDIQQLEMVGTITPVPNAPPFVEGVISMRGQVIPAVNLRARFGFPRVSPDLRARLVVLRAGGRTVGLIVDSAREFAAIPESAIQPPPDGLAETNGRYLEGMAQVGDRLILVLDTAALLDVGGTGPSETPGRRLPEETE